MCKKNKMLKTIKTTLNVASSAASAFAVYNPVLVTIPIIGSICNELCAYYDEKMIMKRLSMLESRLTEQSIAFENFKNRIASLGEHGKYVLSANVRCLCLDALPETSDILIDCIISYLMGKNQDMEEELCQIICNCDANDIKMLSMVKEYMNNGTRSYHEKMLVKLKSDVEEKKNELASKEDLSKTRIARRNKYYDRNVIYGENTIFWKDFTEFYDLVNANDMGVILNVACEDENKNTIYDWVYFGRSLLKLQNEGVFQLEFVTTIGAISQNNIDRFHLTILGQALLKHIKSND